MEMLGNSSLDATRGRHVLRTVFGRGKNLTSDNIMKYKFSSTSYDICKFINKYKKLCFSQQVRSSHMLPELRGLTTVIVFIKSLTSPVAAAGTMCIRGTRQWKWQSEPWFSGYCASYNNISSVIYEEFFYLQLSHWLGMALKSLNASILSASAMASLHGMLPQMGASFLEPLSLNELLHLVTLPGVPTFPPAQVCTVE